MKVSAQFFMKTRYRPLIFTIIYFFLMPRLHVKTFPYEISLLTNKFTNYVTLFTARDEVYKSSWFAYESLGFITDKTKPRHALNTVIKNS